MENLFQKINDLVVVTNAKGDKVEQKQARAIKNELMKDFAELFSMYEVMYDNKGLPVIVLDNGLMIGFDFIVRKLDTELSTQPPKGVK